MRTISRILPRFLYKYLKRVQLKLRILKNKNKEIKLILGSGGITEKGWISTNIETLDITKESDWQRFFRENSVSMILAEHVWEHLTIENASKSAKIIHKYLAPGGHFRIAVPDGFHPDKDYIRNVGVTQNPIEFLLPDSHKVLYNYKTLIESFEKKGFSVKLLEYFDENGLFHENYWAPEFGKIYRSQKYKFERKDISILNMPNYTSLIIDVFKIID